MIVVLGAHPTQGGGNCHVSLGVAARIHCGHVVVHELQLARAVIGAVASESDLEATDGFKLNLGRELLSFGKEGGRSHALVAQQPATLLGLIDIALVGKAKCKVKTGSHHIVTSRLAEDVADFRFELRQRERACSPELHIHILHHHGKSGRVLSKLIQESLLVARSELRYSEFDVFGSLVQDFNRVVVLHFIFYGEAFSVACGCGNTHLLHIHVVLHNQRSVGIQLEGAIEFLGFLGILRVTRLPASRR